MPENKTCRKVTRVCDINAAVREAERRGMEACRDRIRKAREGLSVAFYIEAQCFKNAEMLIEGLIKQAEGFQ